MLLSGYIGTFPPQAPFSLRMIISEKMFGDCPLYSFTVDIYIFGDLLNTAKRNENFSITNKPEIIVYF